VFFKVLEKWTSPQMLSSNLWRLRRAGACLQRWCACAYSRACTVRANISTLLLKTLGP